MRVAVLGGGRSSEHEVSLESSAAVRAGLTEAGHEVVDVRLERDGRWTCAGEPVVLGPGTGLLRCDAVFPVLHGPFGEDGTVQGLLEILDVPYAGAGVLASALCMDKVMFKDLMRAYDIPQVDYAAARSGEPVGEWRSGFPAFVKPSRLGSSVGISKVTDERELETALAEAWKHDPLVIVEAMSHGMEVECAVMGNDDPVASTPGEIVIDADWYDYEAKYTPGGMELVVPARIDEAVREQVRELATRVYRLAGCAGFARADFFVEDGRVLVNELNTIPGFTPTSVFAKLFDASGVPFPELVDRLLALAVERHERERGYRF
jgi:D-alanine-D-alanine ligase